MAKGIGRLVQVGIARETTRGTVVTSPAFWIPWQELDVDEKKAFALDEQTRGVIEDSVGQSIVKEWAEAVLKAPIGSEFFPLMLYSLFGTLVTTDNADTNPIVKDHTISVQQGAQHQSLTLLLDDPVGGQDYTHALAVVTQIEIAYELNNFLMFTANVMAKKGTTATLTPAAATDNRFLPQHLTFKLAATQAGLAAAPAISIRSASLRINQNIESDDVLGNIAPVDFLNKQFAIEGTVEALFQNEADFKTHFQAGTVRAMRLELLNTNVTIGAAANPKIQLDLHSVIFTEMTKPYRLGDLVVQTLSFKAHYNTTDAKIITLVAVNVTASY